MIGISVAESCGIQGTWPDSYSMRRSSRLPAKPQLRPSVWVTTLAQTVTAMIVSLKRSTLLLLARKRLLKIIQI